MHEQRYLKALGKERLGDVREKVMNDGMVIPRIPVAYKRKIQDITGYRVVYLKFPRLSHWYFCEKLCTRALSRKSKPLLFNVSLLFRCGKSLEKNFSLKY